MSGLTPYPGRYILIGMKANPPRYTDMDAAVAAELRAEIARHPDMNISRLADTLEIRRATLSNWLNARSHMTTQTLFDITSALGVSAVEVIRRAESSVTAHPHVEKVAS